MVSISLSFAYIIFVESDSFDVCDMCFMGSFSSETEYCGWNEDNSSEA